MSVHNPDSDRIFMKSRWIPIVSDCRIESPGYFFCDLFPCDYIVNKKKEKKMKNLLFELVV